MASQVKEKLPVLDLSQQQLLYSILLEVGIPANTEAWNRVISRLQPRRGGREIIPQGASLSYRNIVNRWDRNKIFGSNHEELLLAARAPKNGNRPVIRARRDEKNNVEKAGDDDKHGVDGGKKKGTKIGKADKVRKGKGKEKVEVKDAKESEESEEEFGKEKEPGLALNFPDEDGFQPWEPGPSKRDREDKEEGESDVGEPVQAPKKQKKTTKKAEVVQEEEEEEVPVAPIDEVEYSGDEV